MVKQHGNCKPSRKAPAYIQVHVYIYIYIYIYIYTCILGICALASRALSFHLAFHLYDVSNSNNKPEGHSRPPEGPQGVKRISKMLTKTTRPAELNLSAEEHLLKLTSLKLNAAIVAEFVKSRCVKATCVLQLNVLKQIMLEQHELKVGLLKRNLLTLSMLK